jgi:hypothetical protein
LAKPFKGVMYAINLPHRFMEAKMAQKTSTYVAKQIKVGENYATVTINVEGAFKAISGGGAPQLEPHLTITWPCGSGMNDFWFYGDIASPIITLIDEMGQQRICVLGGQGGNVNGVISVPLKAADVMHLTGYTARNSQPGETCLILNVDSEIPDQVKVMEITWDTRDFNHLFGLGPNDRHGYSVITPCGKEHLFYWVPPSYMSNVNGTMKARLSLTNPQPTRDRAAIPDHQLYE